MVSENALKILAARYLVKDEDGTPLESPEGLFRRVADDIAKVEEKYEVPPNEQRKIADQFFKMLNEGLFLPNSPTLMNAGTGNGLGYSACFVVPIPDTMEGIFGALRAQGLIQKGGGGTGFSFSRVRPSGDFVKRTSGVSSGPISFMKLFDAVTETVKQGGKRRGANMAILRCDHPDIKEFIASKDPENRVLKNFNISVAITDAFMEALLDGTEYDLINPRTGESVGRVAAVDIFDMICRHAWLTGDPGIFFIDHANQLEPSDVEIESTNPCGEQPLLPYETCTLGSINLSKVVKAGELDVARLKETVALAVRFLDNVVDRSPYVLPQITKMTRKMRRIGLGVMGWADYLALREIPYDSDAAVNEAESVMKLISDEAMKESIELAEDRGPFPGWEKTSYKGFDPAKVPRNIARTTIAPTGTISRIAGCSSGIEPYYSLVYKSNVLNGQTLLDKVEVLETVLGRHDINVKSEDWKRWADVGGTIQFDDSIPKRLRDVFKTALEIPIERHVQMQAAFQKYTDNAVSKTVNMPNSAMSDDVKKAYLLAWQLGCKGITVYRDGSKAVQVLETSQTRKIPTVDEHGLAKAPNILPATRIRMATGHGTIFITISYDAETRNPLEAFIWQGRSGSCNLAYLEAMGRLISISLRSGVSVNVIIEQLRGERCQHAGPHEGRMVLSIPDAVGQALQEFMSGQGKDVNIEEVPIGECPDCGELLVFESGCERCLVCSYTRCG